MTAKIVSLAKYRAAKGQSGESPELRMPQSKSYCDRRKHPRQGELAVDRRVERRYSPSGECTPVVAWANGTMKIHNISRNGLMAAADLRRSPGSRVLVTAAGGYPMSARVIWKRDGMIGLEAPFGSMELRSI